MWRSPTVVKRGEEQEIKKDYRVRGKGAKRRKRKGKR